DVVRHEAAAEGTVRFVARDREPLPIGLQLVAGVDRGQRRRNPAGLQGVGWIRAAADLAQAEVFARFDDRRANLFTFLVRPPDVEAGRAGHAVAQSADSAARDFDPVHVEELDVGDRSAIELFDHVLRVRTLNLVTVVIADHRLAAGDRRGAFVTRAL